MRPQLDHFVNDVRSGGSDTWIAALGRGVRDAAAGEHGQVDRNRAIAAADGVAVRSKPPHRSPAVSLATYREDPLYPRIARAVAAMLQQGTVVAPVHVLVGMDLLAQEHLEAWRRGRVRCLEEVITCNLTRLSRLPRILRFHAHDLNLLPSVTVYRRWGKGPQRPLRFTRSGDPRIEEAYATHFVWPGKGPFHPPAPRT